jgi:hypothetical protein
VNANDITDNLAIRVASVNDINAETAAIDGVLQIRAITKKEADLNDKFRFSRGEVQGFTGYGVKTISLVIPSTIWGEPVISIGVKAFNDLKYELSHITIGENVAIDKKVWHEESKTSHSTITHDESALPADFIDSYERSGRKSGLYKRPSLGGPWASHEQLEQIAEEGKKVEEQLVRFGVRATLGLGINFGGQSSEWFDMIYGKYDEVNETEWSVVGSGNIAIGLTLSIWPSDIRALAAELNYNYSGSNYCYGSSCSKKSDYFMSIQTSSHLISVPILLRLGKKEGFYLEAGYQFGFPFYSSVTVESGEKFSYSEIKDERSFSEFRNEMDQAIVFGIGYRSRGMVERSYTYSNNSWGIRFIYPLTKLDKGGTLAAPFIIGFTLAKDF